MASTGPENEPAMANFCIKQFIQLMRDFNAIVKRYHTAFVFPDLIGPENSSQQFFPMGQGTEHLTRREGRVEEQPDASNLFQTKRNKTRDKKKITVHAYTGQPE